MEAGSVALIVPESVFEGESEVCASALGCEVTRVDPDQTAGDPIEALAGARAVVIEWDLGSRSGLDWLEAVVRDPRMRGVPVAMCSPAPTRVRVGVALRAGAQTFFHRPLEADELRARLELVAPASPGEAEPGEAPAGESAPDGDPASEDAAEADAESTPEEGAPEQDG